MVHGLRVEPTLAGGARLHECEAAGHMVSSGEAEREEGWCSAAFSHPRPLYSAWDLSLWKAPPRSDRASFFGQMPWKHPHRTAQKCVPGDSRIK